MVILGVITSPDDIQSRWGALNSFKAGIKKCNNPVRCGGLKDDLGKKSVFLKIGKCEIQRTWMKIGQLLYCFDFGR